MKLPLHFNPPSICSSSHIDILTLLYYSCFTKKEIMQQPMFLPETVEGENKSYAHHFLYALLISDNQLIIAIPNKRGNKNVKK